MRFLGSLVTLPGTSDHPDSRAPRWREPGPSRARDPPAPPPASAPGKGAATAALAQESLRTAARPPAKHANLRNPRPHARHAFSSPPPRGLQGPAAARDFGERRCGGTEEAARSPR
ncbi:translation initiation factor IF-2-like [Phyllostomus hastatus]|uniref:translation initiation factor IF-2-like n=1 Tax=Phyllostomus hastatus TaxID=9423 RepID=UPI001E681561|nr:translation initiation factor IF-2-like [Phyllostomus hastatus]